MDIRNKKTKIGIILTAGFLIANMFVTEIWIDIGTILSATLACIGWVAKREREMKWKRVDKKNGHT